MTAQKFEKIKQTLKIWLTAALKIQDERLMHYASSLSFHTIIAIIPVMLLSFSVFTQMPAFARHYARLKEFVFSALLPTHKDVLAGYIDAFLQNSSALGLIGLAAIVFTSAMFFIDYEYVVNEIMPAPKKRGFFAALSSYWTLITLAPLGVAFSFYLSNEFQELLDSTSLTSWINFRAAFAYIVIWAIFCVMYLISVSQPIAPKNALVSSFASSLAWYAGKSAFVYYAIYNKTYLSIYGSFSVLLFFFLWIYVSWIIYLYGLKLCAYLQNLGDKA